MTGGVSGVVDAVLALLDTDELPVGDELPARTFASWSPVTQTDVQSDFSAQSFFVAIVFASISSPVARTKVSCFVVNESAKLAMVCSIVCTSAARAWIAFTMGAMKPM